MDFFEFFAFIQQLAKNANVSCGDLFLTFFAFFIVFFLLCAVICECVSVICRVCCPLSMLSGISTQVRGNGLVAGMMDRGNWGSAEKSIE